MSVMELDPKLARIAEALSRSANGAYDDDFVRDLVAHIAVQFSDVPVRDFVEVLITKEARDELRRLRGSTTPST